MISTNGCNNSAENETTVHGIINNIPSNYHSSDLRNYFSQLIEAGGFDCFHFRHRPEVKAKSSSTSTSTINSSRSIPLPSDADKCASASTYCCIVKMKQFKMKRFMKMYQRKHWLDRKGASIPQRCFIASIDVKDSELSSGLRPAAERQLIGEAGQTFSFSDLCGLPELHPPGVMPNGNVGTPTATFLDLIRDCRLPASVIKKLGLTFPRLEFKGRYSHMAFDYGGDVVKRAVEAEEEEEEETVVSRDGHVIGRGNRPDVAPPFRHRDGATRGEMSDREECNGQVGEDSDPDDDRDGCEEWERHEAFYDDPANQGRNKERLYEDKIELKWEKGGSGLVFYTDANYWKQFEGDFDEQTADDWDMDMSAYYDSDPEAGDKDARDLVNIFKDRRRRQGIQHNQDEPFAGKIGKFEKHTKGIGRRVMEGQGWTDGRGLGSSKIGISEALESDGQPPRSKTGIGYRGEKLNRYVAKKPRQDILISTAYDKAEITDPEEPWYRRGEPTSITYRQYPSFVRATQSDDHVT